MLAFFSFSAAWVNYFLPYLLLGTADNYTLPVGLGILFSSTPALNPGNGAQQSVIARPEIALAGLVLAMPIMIIFLGVVVGGMIVAMYLPIFDMINAVG